MGQVLPFSRSAKEIRILASRQRAQGNLLAAVTLLRLALDRDCFDAETKLMLAELYAQMHCFRLSNRTFFALAHHESYAARCFCGMGQNYYAMRMYSAARDCMGIALQKDPDATLASRAAELFSSLQDSKWLPDPTELALQRRMSRVVRAMDRGKARLAARLVRRMLPLRKGSGSIYALEAFALLAAGMHKEALAAARKALRANRSDIRTMCAMAAALHANRCTEASRTFLSRAAELADDEDEAQFVHHTACEIGQHAFVAAALKELETSVPYHIETLRTLAIALHNIGEHSEAMRRWRQILCIDPMDTVSRFFLEEAQKGTLPGELSYIHQVPITQTLERLKTLREWVYEGADALQARWQADDAVEGLLRWGLHCAEPGIQQAMCGVLATLDGEKAQVVLRELLCDSQTDAQLMRSVLISLTALKAPEPYYALVDDRITVVQVSPAQSNDPPQREARARNLLRLASQWTPSDTPAAIAQMDALCRAAVSIDSGLPTALQARAVVLAHSWLQRLPSPLSSTFAGHRKASRMARRLCALVRA